MTSRSPSLLVSDPGGIRAIAQQISVWRIERRALDVRFPALDDEANAAVRRRISVHYGACGCHQGRVAGFWTLAIFALLVVTGVVSIQALSIGRLVLVYFAISFVTMFIAKIIGLRRARRSLYRLADELDSSLTTKVAHGGLSGVQFTFERLELGNGIELRQTYAHLFAAPMMAFARARSSGLPSWPVEGRRNRRLRLRY